MTKTTAQPRWLTDEEQRIWRSFLHVQRLLNAHLARAMLAEGGMSMADFSVLVNLSEHPDQRMRILELARALRWEKSRLSHQLRRMEERGLLTREGCAEDRRGTWVALTKAGLRAIEAAAPSHVAAVRATFLDALDERELATLGRLCEKAAAHLEELQADCGDTGCDG